MAKFIFITGGVVSSLGKGIATSSIGSILASMGYCVMPKKLDPYLNVDPGTMNPAQHGEVFVTEDGAETDLDLGHYERFIGCNTSRDSNITAGKIYETLIQKERRGDYLGKTVQIIPHVTDLIKEFAIRHNDDKDIIIIEIGGTVGDIEAQPFLESIRQLRHDLGKENTLLIHLTLIPHLASSGEIKTKPTQHSVKELMSIGLSPDILLCRTSVELDEGVRGKISSFCNVDLDCVIEAPDVDNVYKIPVAYLKQGIDKVITKKLNLERKETTIKEETDKLFAKESKGLKKIALICKYNENQDSYKSVNEAVFHAGLHLGYKTSITHVNANDIKTKADAIRLLSDYDAVIVPGGFGTSGIDGKIRAIEFCREHNKPFLGICLGMQLSVIEFARNVLDRKDADSREINPDSSDIIIDIMESWVRDGVVNKADKENLGGTMRLGNDTTSIKKGTLAYKIYGDKAIERHRHRYEVSPDVVEEFEKNGMIFSGFADKSSLPEIIELKDHRFFIAVQFHPEFSSKLFKVNPLFKALLDS